MKLLFFDDRHYAVQGAQRILVRLAALARDAGHEVTVASTKEGALLELARAQQLGTVALGTPERLDQWGGLLSGGRATRLALVFPLFKQNLAIARYVRRSGYDVVWAAAMRPMLSLVLTSLMTKAKVVWHVMSSGYFPVFNEVASLTAGRIVVIADALTPTIGRFHRTRVVRRRTRVLRVGLPRPKDRNVDRESLARSLGLGAGADRKTWIMSIGALVPEKGHLDLIGAVSSMSEQARKETVLVLGGPDTNADHAEEVRTQAAACGVETVVHPWVEDTDAWMRACDIFALASTREGMPLVLIEAIQRDSVAVAYDVGAVSELIEDGKTGRLIPPHAVDALTSALQELVLAPNLRKDLVNNAQRVIEERHTLEAMSHAFNELLEHLVPPKEVKR